MLSSFALMKIMLEAAQRIKAINFTNITESSHGLLNQLCLHQHLVTTWQSLNLAYCLAVSYCSQ